MAKHCTTSVDLFLGLGLLLLGMFGKIRHVPGIAMCLYLGVYLLGMLHMVFYCFFLINFETIFYFCKSKRCLEKKCHWTHTHTHTKLHQNVDDKIE